MLAGGRELVKLVFEVCEEGKLAKDFDTRAQIRAAVLSAMSSMAEGFGRVSSKEFMRFLDISQSSSMEVKSITYVFEDLSYLPNERVSAIREKAEETKGLTLGLIKYLRTRTS